jgi:hypothetical protein
MKHMARWAEVTQANLMLIHGLAMIVLGLGICYVRSTMTDLVFSVIGGALASLLVVAALVFLSVVDWICAIGSGYRQITRLRWLLIVGTSAAACSLVFVFYPSSTVNIFCDLVALYAGCLAVGKLELARGWRGSKQEQSVMYALAAVALGFSVALAIVASRGERLALAFMAAYSLFMGSQILLTLYLLRSRTATVVCQSRG